MSEMMLSYKKLVGTLLEDGTVKIALSILRGTEPPEGLVSVGRTVGDTQMPVYCYPEDLEFFQTYTG